jgi:hypothetical protein
MKTTARSRYDARMTRPSFLVATVSLVLSSAPGAVRAEVKLTAVSDAMAANARDRAEKGRALEQAGRSIEAVGEYRGAIADLDKSLDKPGAGTSKSANPQLYLARAGAEVDAARAISRMPVRDYAAVTDYATRAEADFTTAIGLVMGEPPSAEKSVLLQKATLGRGYARLLRGELTEARTELQGLKLAPPSQAQQVQVTLKGLDKEIAAQAKRPQPTDPKEKARALMNLGLQLVDTFLPKYRGLAVAIGNVADAFSK